MPFLDSAEETLDRPALEALQRRKLAALLPVVREHNPFYRAKLNALRFDPVADALEALPFTTREELQQDQSAYPPYGTNLTEPLDRYIRLHQTSGTSGAPLRWLDTRESWTWSIRCWCLVYRAAGVTPSDRIAFTFSFGPFIGFWLAFEAAQQSGNFCVAAGGMTTSARLRLILEQRITVICCTPTYALRMAEVAEQEGISLADSTVRLLIVAGEPGGSVPTIRQRIEAAWGARVIDHTGSTETSAWGGECVEMPGGVHVFENEFIAEVIDPAGGRPLPDGEAGELVLTNLGRTASPLIRYRTGDRVCLRRTRCACGRWFGRLEGGIVGRIDDMVCVRGNNVYPSAVDAIVRSFAEVAEYRARVIERGALGELTLDVEAQPGAPADLAERVACLFRDRLHFRPVVTLVAPGSLPRFEMKARRWIREREG